MREIGFGFAEGPADAAGEKIAEEIVLPIFRAIAHGDEEDAALAIHAGPNDRIGTALVALVFEHAGVDRADDVDVGGEILERIPFFVEGDRGMHAFQTGEGWIVDDDVGGLQARVAAVNDEFAAEHPQIRIGLRTVCDVTIGEVLRIGFRMEGVAGSVAADESETLLDGGEQGLLAGRGHGGIFVGAGLGEIAGGEEEDGLMGVEIFGVEDAAVFGAGDFKAVLGSELGEDGFADGELAVLTLHDFVFEAGGFGEDEERFF